MIFFAVKGVHKWVVFVGKTAPWLWFNDLLHRKPLPDCGLMIFYPDNHSTNMFYWLHSVRKSYGHIYLLANLHNTTDLVDSNSSWFRTGFNYKSPRSETTGRLFPTYDISPSSPVHPPPNPRYYRLSCHAWATHPSHAQHGRRIPHWDFHGFRLMWTRFK